jgi:hypothetical protein
MKAALLTLIIAAQFVAPPQAPPPPPQRGQAPIPSNAPAPLNAAECKCSIEVFVKRPNGEAIGDVDLTVTIATGATPFIQAPAAATGVAPASLTATTDSSGRAVFRNLAEGNYTVLARREGYFGIANDTFPAQANARVPVGPAAATTAAGPTPAARGAVAPARQPVQQVTLNMVQGSTIAGRILDGNRRLASGIQVGAYRVTYQYGHRVLTQAGQAGTVAQSDDRGEYRLFWYPPGEYFIHTGAARGGLIAANGGSTYPNVTYYPGTQDQRSAAPIIVGEGTAITGIDITIPASSGVTISGTIVNTIPGGGVGRRGQQISRSVSSVFLVPRNAPFFENPVLIPNVAGASLAARGGNGVNTDETPFEIRGVPPGTYDLYPIYSDGSTAVFNNPLGYYFARTRIEVGSETVTGIRSVIQPGANLKGHVTITGNPPAAPNRPAQPVNITGIRLQFQPMENLPSLVRTQAQTVIPIDTEGGFNLVNLVEARYSIIAATGLPADAFVSEIRLDSRNVSDDGFINIAGNSQLNLEVTISRGGGSIQGTAQDAKHNPVAAARITLIPDLPRRENFLLYKTAMSTAMGTFTLNGVAPGSYKLFAWEQIPNGAEQDSDFMREYDLLGTSINMTAGLAQTNVQLTPIPAKH